jgi:hypothetical protein
MRAGSESALTPAFALPFHPRPHIDTVRGRFISELGYERIGNRFRQERFERRELGSLFFTAHSRTLSQLIAKA